MGGHGGLKSQAVGGEVGALNTFQVQIGGDFLVFDGTEIRMADVFPGFFAIENAVFDLVKLERPLQAEEDRFPLNGADAFLFAGADQTTSQDLALGQRPDFLHVDTADIIGKNVDDDGTVQDAAGVLIVQRHSGRDEVDVGAGRRAREGLVIQHFVFIY